MKKSSSRYSDIDAYVEREMGRLKMPGVSLAIVEGDRVVHQRGFGRARPGGEAPSPQTPFFIASLTKSFTALAVMQLFEAGKIDLDASVQSYLPWFRVADPQASAQITVRHLLNQTSGLPASSGEIPLADFDDSPDAAERQARALSTLVLTRPVGSKFEYCNSNYNLLGLIIEAAGGESYADYIQEHILTPLRMNHTYTSPDAAKQNGLAVGHQYWFAHPFAAPDMPLPHGSLPGGLLISCAEDLARFLLVHLNYGRLGDVQILSSAGICELQRGAADFVYMNIPLGKYGMGWFVDKIGEEDLLWHSGTLPDFFAYMALLPEQEKGVVLLFNADHHWMSPVLTGIGTGVAERLAGVEPQPAPVPFVGLIPWMLRGLLLIPALQVVGVLTILRRINDGRPKGPNLFLSLLPTLLAALAIRPMLGKRRGYLRLYMPDCYWITLISGSFALAWGVLRTGLYFWKNGRYRKEQAVTR